ncbi:MAG: histidine phosphatase family protein [Pseudomonadota bacterium]
MKTLIILRHAKSSWAQPGLSDFERPLNGRGRGQLQRLAQWFADQELKDLAIACSPSARTRETFAGIADSLPNKEPDFVKALYNGTMDDYLEAIWSQPDTTGTLLLVGHNPTCDELSRYLTAPSSQAAPKLLAHHFGTACLARLEVPVDHWSAIAPSANQLTDFVRPADLETAPAA